VVVKGTTHGTFTDANGNYSLPNVPADGTLMFSFVGMRSQELPIGGQSVITVSMLEEAIGIDEVVAIGYGTQKKRDVTGALANIMWKNYLKYQSRVLVKNYKVSLPGFKINQKYGEPGGALSFRIRGAASINAGNNP
jgi:hypothetical protein